MQKSKVEWTDFVWNPIKGMCPVDCKTPDGKSYCYARRMYQRFKWDPKITLDLQPLEFYGRIPDGSRIFICSTFEIFHPSIPAHYRDWIFGEIKDYENLTFIILTKMPERIDRPMPDNVWLGVSITEQGDADKRIPFLLEARAKVKFLSVEPMLGPIDFFNWIGYNPIHEHQLCNGKTGIGCSEKGGFGSRFRRADLVAEKARLGQMEEKGSESTMPPSEGRTHNAPWVSSGSGYDKSNPGLYERPSNSLLDSCWPDSSGNVDQSQKRNQKRQSTIKSGIGDPERERYARPQGAKSRETGPGRGKEFYASTDGGSRKGYSAPSKSIPGGSQNQTGPCRIQSNETIRGIPTDDFPGPQKTILGLNLIIIGRLTGHGHKHDPRRATVGAIVQFGRQWGIPVFLKNNLREIWGKPLIQEFPK